MPKEERDVELIIRKNLTLMITIHGVPLILILAILYYAFNLTDIEAIKSFVSPYQGNQSLNNYAMREHRSSTYAKAALLLGALIHLGCIIYSILTYYPKRLVFNSEGFLDLMEQPRGKFIHFSEMDYLWFSYNSLEIKTNNNLLKYYFLKLENTKVTKIKDLYNQHSNQPKTLKQSIDKYVYLQTPSSADQFWSLKLALEGEGIPYKVEGQFLYDPPLFGELSWKTQSEFHVPAKYIKKAKELSNLSINFS